MVAGVPHNGVEVDKVCRDGVLGIHPHHDRGVWEDKKAFCCNLCFLQINLPYRIFCNGNLVYLKLPELILLLLHQLLGPIVQQPKHCRFAHCR